MPNFRATYEEWEDGNTDHFDVDARNILEAWHKAQEHIHSLQHSGSLESLRGEDGKIYFSDRIERYVAESKRFVLLSGPSGIGKTPLRKATKAKVKFKRAILYTSRPPKEDEVPEIDYHFRSSEFIQSLADNPHYIVGQVRDMWQAIDLADLDFSENDLVFVEAYHALGAKLRENLYLPPDVIPISIFMSPLSAAEIAGLKEKTDLEAHVTDLIRDKQKVRTQASGNPYDTLPADEQEAIEIKARDAFSELKSAHLYDYVLVNHDGEAHPNWETLSGDAGNAVRALTRILKYGIYRPHISIGESNGEVGFHQTDPIESWTPETI